MRFSILLSLFSVVFSAKSSKRQSLLCPPKIRTAYTPIGDCQKEYCAGLADPAIPILAGLGPAGCGKTLFACNAAVAALQSGLVDRIVLTRPMVAVDEELGFLPGSILQKMDPWIRPVFDILGEVYSATEVRRMMEDGVIEIAPLAYMRGRTFKRTFLIADEMQNSTPNQMLMILTRIGVDSKLVITGDLMQSDLRNGMNGLEDFYGRIRKRGSENSDIKVVEFGVGDVRRSSVVSSVLALYSSDGVKKNSHVGGASAGASGEASSGEAALNRGSTAEVSDAALIPKAYYKGI